MTIAPKKPRVEGGAQRQPAGAAPAQPPSASRSRSGKGVASPAQPPPPEEPERNSDDERETGGLSAAAAAAEEEEERLFRDRLKASGLVIKAMGDDGACLFRAVADQIYGDQDFHPTVRNLCMDYMEKNRDYFSQFVTEDWRDYVRRKRAADAHGNNVEIQAMAELFCRPIEVYRPGQSAVNAAGVLQPINTFQCPNAAEKNPPIRVSYHGTVHYNSLLEPWGPATVGVGLGLPGLEPGTAQTAAIRDAVSLSEREGIEQAMLEDKIRATDREATTSDLTAQVARESYLDYIREQEERLRKENAPCHSGSLPAAPKRSPKPTSSAKAGLASRPSSPKAPSPKAAGSAKEETGALGGALGPLETASILNSLPASVFGLADFDLSDEGDGDVLSRVLALSQQEYLDSFKVSPLQPLSLGLEQDTGRANRRRRRAEPPTPAVRRALLLPASMHSFPLPKRAPS